MMANELKALFWNPTKIPPVEGTLSDDSKFTCSCAGLRDTGVVDKDSILKRQAMLELMKCDTLPNKKESDCQKDAGAADEPNRILADNPCMPKLKPSTDIKAAPVEMPFCLGNKKDVMDWLDLSNVMLTVDFNPPMLIDICVVAPPMG